MFRVGRRFRIGGSAVRVRVVRGHRVRGSPTQWSSVVVVVGRDIAITKMVLVSIVRFGIRVARFGGGNLRSGVFIGNMRTVAHSVAAMTTMAVPIAIVLVIVVAVVGLVPAIGVGGLYILKIQIN